MVLHSHIPYVLSHGRWPHGTDWLLEVTAESYIPLLDIMYDLVEEGYSPKLTIGLTPVLVEQLADESFKYEFAAYVRMKARAAAENKKQFEQSGNSHLAYLADFWQDFYWKVFNNFKKRYGRDLVKAFAQLQDDGHIEVITSAATHGYFPLLSQDTSIQAQVKQGIQTYRKYFNRQPSGFWLPECAYRPSYRWSPPLQPKSRTIKPYIRKGVEEFLSENGIKYFIIESHLLTGGETRGVYVDRFGALQKLWKQFTAESSTTFEPAKTPYMPYVIRSTQNSKSPVSVFVRDHTTGSQVWSRWQGYPGDEWYLEFHKKHTPGGHKYWRVTGPDTDLGDKRVYEPHRAEEMTGFHCAHFMNVVKNVLRQHLDQTGSPGIICAPYDTELYGHWWMEGIRWIYRVIKAMHDDPAVEMVTCSEYLENNPPTASIVLPEGSWGEGGFHYMWLNENTDWTWPYVYDAELEMADLVKNFSENKEVLPILKQAARELLLLQSSDWQFCISTGSSKDYGELRLTEHYKNFQRLADIIRRLASGGEVDEEEWHFYKICEERDSLFPDIDPRWWMDVEQPATEVSKTQA
jgi:1,4-alpha-glucan branching enzyme